MWLKTKTQAIKAGVPTAARAALEAAAVRHRNGEAHGLSEDECKFDEILAAQLLDVLDGEALTVAQGVPLWAAASGAEYLSGTRIVIRLTDVFEIKNSQQAAVQLSKMKSFRMFKIDTVEGIFQKLQYEVDVYNQHVQDQDRMSDQDQTEILLSWLEGVPHLSNLRSLICTSQAYAAAEGDMAQPQLTLIKLRRIVEQLQAVAEANKDAATMERRALQHARVAHRQRHPPARRGQQARRTGRGQSNQFEHLSPEWSVNDGYHHPFDRATGKPYPAYHASQSSVARSVLDSGCTTTLVPFPSLLRDVKGDKTDIQGIGETVRTTAVGILDLPRLGIALEARVLPGLGMTLLSERQLAAGGIRTMWEGEHKRSLHYVDPDSAHERRLDLEEVDGLFALPKGWGADGPFASSGLLAGEKRGQSIDYARAHQLLGHVGRARIQQQTKKLLYDVQGYERACDACAHAELRRAPVASSTAHPPKLPLERLHIDGTSLRCVARAPYKGAQYMLYITDALSSYTWLVPAERRSDYAPLLRDWVRTTGRFVSESTSKRIREIAGDQEFSGNQAVVKYLNEQGISVRAFEGNRPELNGVVEQPIYRIRVIAKALLKQAGLGEGQHSQYLVHALMHACWLRNRIVRPNTDKSPYEILYGFPVPEDLMTLPVFGEHVWIKKSKAVKHYEDAVKPGMFLGVTAKPGRTFQKGGLLFETQSGRLVERATWAPREQVPSRFTSSSPVQRSAPAARYASDTESERSLGKDPESATGPALPPGLDIDQAAASG